MHVFLSHCVKEDDLPEVHALKKSLISELEAADFSVYEYVDREGSTENWLKDVRNNLRISSFVIYFARQWPEPEPGNCLIELGAAQILEIPIYVYRPSELSGHRNTMFAGFAAKFNEVFKTGTDRDSRDIGKLVQRLMGQRKEQPGKHHVLETLRRVFIDGLPPHGNPLEQTGIVLRDLRLAKRSAGQGGLALRHMRRIQSLERITCYWRIPERRSVIALCGAGAGRSKISEFVPSTEVWGTSGDSFISIDASRLSKNTFSIGTVFDDDRVCFLIHDRTDWRLVGYKLDVQFQFVDVELERRQSVTCMRRFSDGRSGLFADSGFFEFVIDADRKGGKIVQSQNPPDEMPDEYCGPPDALGRRRLGSIAGAPELNAFVSEGRAEAIAFDGEYWAIRQVGSMLYLGKWEEIETRKLLSCLRRKADDQHCIGFRPPAGFTETLSAQENSPLEWYWACLRDCNSNYIDGLTWFNSSLREPRVFEADCSGSLNLEMVDLAPETVYSLELKWTNELRDRLWNVLDAPTVHEPAPPPRE